MYSRVFRDRRDELEKDEEPTKMTGQIPPDPSEEAGRGKGQRIQKDDLRLN